MDALSPKQQISLGTLRENVADILQPHHDDYFLSRWLIARCWDVKKAESMLRASMEWRKRMEADTVSEWTAPEVLLRYWPCSYFGVDKEGRPLWIDMPGNLDMRGLLHSARKQDILKFKVQQLEQNNLLLEEQSRKLGKRIPKACLIMDLEHYGLKHLWKPGMDLLIDAFQMIEQNYPELLHACYIVNAPKIFPIAYNLIKPFLNEGTKRRINILTGDWKSKLLEYIDADQLPQHWGGTCTDPDGDPFCRSKVCVGGIVPQSYYSTKGQWDVNTADLTVATIRRGSSLQLEYMVSQPNSVIRWYFHTENYDVGYGIFLRTANERQKANAMVTIQTTRRVNSYLVPEDGSLTCDKTGIYVVRFDNTYSWVNSKKVSYIIEVLQSTNGSEDMCETDQLQTSEVVCNHSNNEAICDTDQS